MRYIKDSFNYMFVRGKGMRFLCIFLIAIIPSALLAYAFPLDRFVLHIFFPVPRNWGNLWLSYFSSKYSFASLGLGLLFSVLTNTIISSVLIRHMRIGDFKITQVFRSFNDYFVPALLYVLMTFFIFTFMFTLYTLFEFAWAFSAYKIIYIIATLLSLLVISVGIAFIMSSLTLWHPTMCIKGIYKNALTKAFYQSRSKQKLFLPGHIVAMSILIVTSLISALATNYWLISWIVNSIGYACTYTFISVFMMVTYFGENLLPREDLNRSPYKRR